MSDDIAIRVDHVSKTFKLPHEKNTSIKSAFVNFYRRNKTFEKQEVLKDVSFEVKKGEFFGIVGRNGSGKSTLLKMLAGIYTPSKGGIAINGKLTPFIELGVGFNMELTGRENVFLNGALLGFSRQEMMGMYDDIVAFAELDRFMDQKLKNYSSGMQVRLAFSIAIQANTDILVLDEVLAVGDEAFQQKCIDVFEMYKAKKQTIVLVTHDMAAVKKFCTRALLINDGKIVAQGQPADIASKYSKLNYQAPSKSPSTSEMVRITMKDADGKVENKFQVGQKMALEFVLEKNDPQISNLGVAIIKNSGEYIYGTNTLETQYKIAANKPLTYTLDLQLGPGKYHVSYGLFGKSAQEVVEFIENGPEFIVDETDHLAAEGLVRLNHSWREG